MVWEKGRLKLADGASLARSVKVGSWLKVSAGIEFPELTKDGEKSFTALRIDLVGATDCYVSWQQTGKDGKTVSRISILDTVPKDGKA